LEGAAQLNGDEQIRRFRQLFFRLGINLGVGTASAAGHPGRDVSAAPEADLMMASRSRTAAFPRPRSNRSRNEACGNAVVSSK